MIYSIEAGAWIAPASIYLEVDLIPRIVPNNRRLHYGIHFRSHWVDHFRN